MKIRLLLLSTLSFSSLSQSAKDWDELPIPAKPVDGMKWEIQPVSDSFKYEAKPTEKPKEFTSRWQSKFINKWIGPGKTKWNPGHSHVTNGHLGIHASRKKGSHEVYTGIITSKEAFTYPLYIEAKAKISNQVLASNVWMLSADSTEEIDILEA